MEDTTSINGNLKGHFREIMNNAMILHSDDTLSNHDFSLSSYSDSSIDSTIDNKYMVLKNSTPQNFLWLNEINQISPINNLSDINERELINKANIESLNDDFKNYQTSANGSSVDLPLKQGLYIRPFLTNQKSNVCQTINSINTDKNQETNDNFSDYYRNDDSMNSSLSFKNYFMEKLSTIIEESTSLENNKSLNLTGQILDKLSSVISSSEANNLLSSSLLSDSTISSNSSLSNSAIISALKSVQISSTYNSSVSSFNDSLSLSKLSPLHSISEDDKSNDSSLTFNSEVYSNTSVSSNFQECRPITENSQKLLNNSFSLTSKNCNVHSKFDLNVQYKKDKSPSNIISPNTSSKVTCAKTTSLNNGKLKNLRVARKSPNKMPNFAPHSKIATKVIDKSKMFEEKTVKNSNINKIEKLQNTKQKNSFQSIPSKPNVSKGIVNKTVNAKPNHLACKTLALKKQSPYKIKGASNIVNSISSKKQISSPSISVSPIKPVSILKDMFSVKKDIKNWSDRKNNRIPKKLTIPLIFVTNPSDVTKCVFGKKS